MKNFVYILVDIVFFNLSAWLLYYLGLVNNTNFVIFDGLIDILITNLIFVVFLWFYLIIYIKYLMKQFGYFKIAGLGLFVGVIFTLFIPTSNAQEKIFIVTFTSFSITFLSYSVYFDSVKHKVFQ